MVHIGYFSCGGTVGPAAEDGTAGGGKQADGAAASVEAVNRMEAHPASCLAGPDPGRTGPPRSKAGLWASMTVVTEAAEEAAGT